MNIWFKDFSASASQVMETGVYRHDTNITSPNSTKQSLNNSALTVLTNHILPVNFWNDSVWNMTSLGTLNYSQLKERIMVVEWYLICCSTYSFNTTAFLLSHEAEIPRQPIWTRIWFWNWEINSWNFVVVEVDSEFLSTR